MTSAMRVLAVGLLLGAALGLRAAPPTPAEIAKAIKQLGDDSFDKRQKASDLLRAAGRAAEPALLEATKSTDAEVSRRAAEILDEFKWGIYPDTPPQVGDLINRYRTGDTEAKLQAVRELLKAGAHGATSIAKIVVAEDVGNTRSQVHDAVKQYLAENVAAWLLADDHATVQRTVELALRSDRDTGYRDYAAWLFFRGKLDDRIPHYRALAEKSDAKAAEVLFYLCRAKGDRPGARWAAEKLADKPRLLQAILTEAGDWRELARQFTKKDPNTHGVEGLTLAVAYHRLAGNAAELEQAVAELSKLVGAGTEEPTYAGLAAKGLFLNDRPDEALALLLRGKQYREAFDILSFQSKYKEALALAPKAEADKTFQLSHARVLHTLGLRDQARPLLAKLADELEDRDTPPAARDLLRVYTRVGLKDEALAYTARLLRKDSVPETRDALLGVLFPDQGANAGIWWTVLRNEHTADETVAILKKLTLLAEGRMPAKDFDNLLKKAEEVGLGAKEGGEVALQQGLAEACATAGQTDRAIAYLEKALPKATDATVAQRLGDLLAEKLSWAAAAERYKEAWEKDRTQPLPLFLHGQALRQAGKEAEGTKAIEVAHELPLGNEYVRYQFAKALAERNHAAHAKRERELILRLGALEGWAVNETYRLQAYAAQQRKDYLEAADWFEQFRLRCMRANVSFIEPTAHVQVPGMAHQNRARGLVAAGKFVEAKQEWQLDLKLVPGNVSVPIALIAGLEQAGRKPDADELFASVFELHAKLCQDYPASASQHNTLAWLAGLCRRKLDVGAEHAARAVQLEPNNAGYMDTLAEVQFQRGQQAKAIELMKRCLALEPKNDYFRKQLKRFEAGDPRADVPDEGE